jgi:hypothetical protein
VRDSRGKNQTQEEKDVAQILCADSHSKSGVEASDDDYFEEEAQKMFWDSESP